MYVKSLKLINFRNYDEAHLNFNKNINLLLGKNGQGKTNILEAIYSLSIGKSFRTNRDKDLIKFDKKNSYVGGLFVKEEDDNIIEVVIRKDSKKGIKVNKISIEKISQLLGNLNVVVFSPEDLKLVKEGPKERRKFIDREISQIIPMYYNYILNYNKILIQRNKLLKSNYINENLLDIYDERLCEYGSYIYFYRRDFIKKIGILAQLIHKKLTDEIEELKIKYINQIDVNFDNTCEDIRDKFLKILKSNRELDKQNRTTKFGPHRDDINILINSLDVRLYGSQGQQRTASISLKLSEIELIKEEIGEYPVLLLDDIFSELDQKRQQLLVDSFEHIQVFITSAEDTHKRIFENKDVSIFYIEKGRAIY
ncbi:DNA replication/repair protein RecF [Tepidibacter formicigenes]|uniref:DNA replication and repair protein RecF n=1 Tax=Tepidibacter formicigenes DSM 15518 TaxID=1123349 RepID=A0A1M6P7Y9_9FIRM|nr:DNA replication/repair protein RecF [Tepidibacter formicigenes]SHK03995.1 DNA replication and repair protein RecF [Tepidibacter formicigenes DSM 15518]